MLLLCNIDIVYGTLGDFFNNFPDNIGNAISNVWDSVNAAIRRPVKLRRLGAGGKRKTTATTATTQPETISNTQPLRTTTIELRTVGTTTELSTSIDLLSTKVRRLPLHLEDNVSSRKVRVPHIRQPLWRCFEDWYNLQKPPFPKLEDSRETKLTPTSSDMVISNKHKITIPVIVPRISNYIYMMRAIPPRKSMKDTSYLH
ncbi:uncharacterized protein LOC131846273 [Achroia grisella]|uniref:uncharacterized protein LOC131846273 n=1 Tax=Achroia grisella TaxID=688607 RepID=UPI0027D2C7DE|nr:uncharacterized protein LOC131846273 [Achroia grisella]